MLQLTFNPGSTLAGVRTTRSCSSVVLGLLVVPVVYPRRLSWTYYRCGLDLYHDEMPLASIKQPLASITHNTFRHCRVRFYTFVGQPFLKQLYKGNKMRWSSLALYITANNPPHIFSQDSRI